MTGTFLDGRAWTTLRGAAYLALSETGHVVSGSVVSDSGGGGTTTWTAGTGIPCSIDSLTGGEGVLGGRIDDRSTHLITVPGGLAVTVADTFAIDSRGTFEITAVREHTSELLRLLEAYSTA